MTTPHDANGLSLDERIRRAERDVMLHDRRLLRADMRAHLGRLSSVHTWLRAEIGYAEISSQDLSSLRVKDVVLVDAFTARPDRGEPGTARLRLGLGRLGCLNAEVFLEGGQYQARITQVLLGEQAFLAHRMGGEIEHDHRPLEGQLWN